MTRHLLAVYILGCERRTVCAKVLTIAAILTVLLCFYLICLICRHYVQQGRCVYDILADSHDKLQCLLSDQQRAKQDHQYYMLLVAPIHRHSIAG